MVPFRLRQADRVVAGFLLLAFLVTSAVLILVFKNQGLLRRRVTYRTVFADGGGIRAETPVKLAGIEVGAVRRVRLTDDDQVEVTFDILEEYSDRLRADPPGDLCKRKATMGMLLSDTEKKTEDDRKRLCGTRVAVSLPAGLGAFLQSGLELKVGNRQNPLVDPDGFVPAEESEGLNELFSRLQKEGLVQSARDIVVQVDTLLKTINDQEGPVQSTLRHVEEVTGRAAAGKGLVGEITRDNSPTQQKVTASLEKLDRSLEQLEQASHDVAKVIAGVSQRSEDIDLLITNLQEFSSTAKEVGRDLQVFAEDSKAVPPDVRSAIANLNARIDDLGAIIGGLKNSFPLNMVVEDPKKKAPAAPSTAPSKTP